MERSFFALFTFFTLLPYTAKAGLAGWFSGDLIQQAQEAGFLPEPSQWEMLQTWVLTLLT